MSIDPNVLDRYRQLRRSWFTGGDSEPPAKTMADARNYCDYHVFGTKVSRPWPGALLVGPHNHDPGDEDRR